MNNQILDDRKFNEKELMENFPILYDEQLFNKIMQEFTKKIEGEQDSIHTIFLCSCGILVTNNDLASYNLLVNDVSGAGKDYVTHNTLKIWHKDVVHKRTRITPTAFTYWKQLTKKQKLEGVPEWNWNGNIVYLEDVSNNVLNSDVFKVMCSTGTDAVIVKDQRAVEIKINGKPVMFVTSASAAPNPELLRRFSIVNLDSGNEQTRNILLRQAAAAAQGNSLKYDSNISAALSYLKRYKVKVSFGNLIANHVPDAINMRTHFPRLLDYIRASCALHQYQRQYENGYLIAEKQDYEIARKAILKTTTNKFMIPLTKNQKTILELMEKKGKDSYFSVNDVLSAQNVYSSSKTLIKALDKLTELDLLERNLQTIEGYNKEVKHYQIKDTTKIELPKWEKLQD